jgi:hypothetical protein
LIAQSCQFFLFHKDFLLYKSAGRIPAPLPQYPVCLPELVDIKVTEMAVLYWNTHLLGQPAVGIAPLLVCVLLALPQRVKQGMAQLLSLSHRLVGQ